MPKTSVDPDAQAFITAASITNPTQQAAINTLVVDLKGYNIWTKFKAIYPIVGGTASSHKYNLKDPRDLDAAFRLTFASGWTHSSTGMTPLNTFANTFFNPNSGFSTNDNVHLSYYSRTNSNGTEIEMGSTINLAGPYLMLEIRTSGTTYYIMNSVGSYATASDSDSRAFYIGNRIGTAEKGFRNNTNVISRTSTASPRPNFNTYLGAANYGGTATYLSTKECAFSSIGDGLTDTEAANFYTAVQAYQTTLGRQIGVPIVSDSDAQAFLNAADITDVTQANAVNNLVIGMKADGIWTKMKAIYPIVGGTASSHAVNLKTPGTFNLSFATGVTHSSNGMVGNGSTGYADTNFTPSTNGMLLNSAHLSFYSRTDLNTYQVEMGNWNGSASTLLLIRQAGNGTVRMNNGALNINFANTNAQGFYLSNRTASNVIKAFKNGAVQVTSAQVSNSLPTNKIALLAFNDNGLIQYYSTKQCAFASIGDGLTDTDAANFYTAVQAFQTTLNRQV